jgi:hypothetical protein
VRLGEPDPVGDHRVAQSLALSRGQML